MLCFSRDDRSWGLGFDSIYARTWRHFKQARIHVLFSIKGFVRQRNTNSATKNLVWGSFFSLLDRLSVLRWAWLLSKAIRETARDIWKIRLGINLSYCISKGRAAKGVLNITVWEAMRILDRIGVLVRNDWKDQSQGKNENGKNTDGQKVGMSKKHTSPSKIFTLFFKNPFDIGLLTNFIHSMNLYQPWTLCVCGSTMDAIKDFDVKTNSGGESIPKTVILVWSHIFP